MNEEVETISGNFNVRVKMIDNSVYDLEISSEMMVEALQELIQVYFFVHWHNVAYFTEIFYYLNGI